MNKFTYIIPLIALIIGWFLNELSLVFRVRRDDRRAIARAVADLLEIRHRLFAVKKVPEEIKKRFNISDHEQVLFGTILNSFLPDPEGLHKRYDEAVGVIASANPLLGFRLRSQDFLPALIGYLRLIASGDKNASKVWHKIESQLTSFIDPHLNEMITELAWRHGWLTWVKVRRYIRKPFESPRELDEFFQTMSSFVSVNQQTQVRKEQK